MLVHDAEKRGEVQNGSLGIIFIILRDFSNLLTNINRVSLQKILLEMAVRPLFFIYIAKRVLYRVCYITLDAGTHCSSEFCS